ncbi:hypothetical protein ACM26E_08650 [Kluyvera cryocrescens]|uniref:hypothetical protein n=1 Tax=Kluyvera cryocrescens TaxID=580 RepID=UPI0039F4B669
MTINLTDPANHPANGQLTDERITRVRDELQSSLQYQNGGDMAYVIADAVKGLEELLVSRKVDQLTGDERIMEIEGIATIIPVADLYGITSPTGSETTFTFDAIEASSFVGSGWSVQEYVELERYQEAIVGAFRENVNSSTKHFREITETSTNFPRCGGHGTYHCPKMLGTVECECTLPAAPQEVKC